MVHITFLAGSGLGGSIAGKHGNKEKGWGRQQNTEEGRKEAKRAHDSDNDPAYTSGSHALPPNLGRREKSGTVWTQGDPWG